MTKGTLTRWWVAALVAVLGSVSLVGCGDDGTGADPNDATTSKPTGAGAPVAEGRIAFVRGDPEEGDTLTYTVNPDGSDEAQLFDEPSEGPRWAPSGAEMQIFCCGDGMAAHFVDPDTGEIVRSLPPPEPRLETNCGGAWSPDGERIACEVFGKDERLNGVYSIRVSDGGGLTRITDARPGGFDVPLDYSPEGDRLVFGRFVDDEAVGIFITDLDGDDVRRISPPDVRVDGARWSPDGSRILLEVYESEEHHAEIWVVSPDGSDPHELPIDPACGGLNADPDAVGCFDPAWSPDGSQIAFARTNADGEANIYVVNLDGSGLAQVTDGAFDHQPDWGAPSAGA